MIFNASDVGAGLVLLVMYLIDLSVLQSTSEGQTDGRFHVTQQHFRLTSSRVGPVHSSAQLGQTHYRTTTNKTGFVLDLV